MIRKYAQSEGRPPNFLKDLSHPFFRACVFAALGEQGYGSGEMFDSSIFRNHGLLTSYTGAGNTPPEMWGREIGRARLASAGSDRVVVTPQANWPLASGLFRGGTVAVWFRTTSIAVGTTGILSMASSYNASTAVTLLIQRSAATLRVLYDSTAYVTLGTISVGPWYHVAWVNSDQHYWFFNGALVGNHANASSTCTPTGLYINSGYPGTLLGATADPAVWARPLSSAEIARRADPSDVMLGGAIYTRPNRAIVGQAGAAPATIRRGRLPLLGVC